MTEQLGEETQRAAKLAEKSAQENNGSQTEEEDDDEPQSPIAAAIDEFLHRVRDVEFATFFIDLAVKISDKQADDIEKDLETIDALLSDADEAVQARGIRQMEGIQRRIVRYKKTDVPRLLENSLFQNLFSAYDAFTGELLRAIYLKRPELFAKIRREVAVSDILRYSSFDELKAAVLEEEIESVRRKSYVEQFGELETTFGLKLRAFEHWPAFVEAAQRRNIITHCDGIVTEQYLSVCRREKAECSFKVGDIIGLGPEYFMSVTTIMAEVAVKLGQSLWRKLFPDELEAADEHLNNTAYDYLLEEEWEKARILGEFAVTLPRQSTDVKRRLATVNLAIAQAAVGQTPEVEKTLGTLDWSASAKDFRLAEAVLLTRYSNAAALMRSIGPEGDFVTEAAYHNWPLFRAFRSNPLFLEAYEAVYGHPFAEQAQRAADAAIVEVRTERDHQSRAREDEGKTPPTSVDGDNSKRDA